MIHIEVHGEGYTGSPTITLCGERGFFLDVADEPHEAECPDCIVRRDAARLVIDNDREALLAEYDAWQAEREELSAAESEGNYPRDSDWHASDDTAVELLRQAVELLRPTP